MQCEPDSWGEVGRGEDAEEGGIILWHYCSHNGGRGRTKNATHSLSSSSGSSQSEARSRPTNTYLLFSIDEEGCNAEKRRDATFRERERASSNSFAVDSCEERLHPDCRSSRRRCLLQFIRAVVHVREWPHIDDFR